MTSLPLKMLILPLTAMVSILASSPGQAETNIYFCQNEQGQTTFSDTPCSPKAEKRRIDAPAPGTGGEQALKGQTRLAEQFRQQQAEQRARRAARPPQNQPEEQTTEKDHTQSQRPQIYYPYYPRPRPKQQPPPTPAPKTEPPPTPGYSGRYPGGFPGYNPPR